MALAKIKTEEELARLDTIFAEIEAERESDGPTNSSTVNEMQMQGVTASERRLEAQTAASIAQEMQGSCSRTTRSGQNGNACSPRH